MTFDFLIALFLVGSPAAALVLLLLYCLHRSRRRDEQAGRHGRRFEVAPRHDAARDDRHAPPLDQ